MALKRIWYSGYELKKRWSISERDLIHYLITGELIAYKSPGSEPYSKEYIKDLDQNDYWQLLFDHGPCGFIYHTDNVLEFEKKHNITVYLDKYKNEAKNSVSEKKLRPNQKAKIECRKIAKKLWDNNPSITIADMIVSDEINDACIKITETTFTEKTLRKWINDLCPNRSPGRRKGP